MGESESRLSDREMADLCALADGTLPPERRRAVEAWVAASPDRRALFDRQRRSLAATAPASREPEPASLRAAVESQSSRRAPRSRRLLPRLAFAGGAAAVAAIALVLALNGGATDPTVADAAELAARPPSGPAPARAEGSRTQLAVSVEGLEFPDFRRAYGWRPSGLRVDTVDGRDATVVYYRKGERRIAYVIVSGAGLAPPADAHGPVRRGVEFRVLRAGDRPAVTWQRSGHTCVLAGEASGAELLRLAAWRGGGLAY
jgi:anti-sigma factor RsiW